MVSGGVNKCIKYALFSFNLAFVVIGSILLGLGISTLTNGLRYLSLVDTNSFVGPPKFFIAIGVIMLLIAFLGCCGACMENHAMVMAYSVLVSLILILQLGVGIAAVTLEDEVESIASAGLNTTLMKYHNTKADGVTDIRSSWDMVQIDLKCCGVTNYTNWKISNDGIDPTDLFVNDTLVPSSCCIHGATQGCAGAITKDNIDTFDASAIVFTEGCVSKAVGHLAITRMGVVGIGLAVVELLGVICACLLARSIRFSYETV